MARDLKPPQLGSRGGCTARKKPRGSCEPALLAHPYNLLEPQPLHPRDQNEGLFRHGLIGEVPRERAYFLVSA